MVVVGGAYKIDSRRHTIVKFSSTGRDGPLSHDLGRLHIFAISIRDDAIFMVKDDDCES